MMSSIGLSTERSSGTSSVQSDTVVSRESCDAPGARLDFDEAESSAATGDVHLVWLIDQALRATGYLCLRDLDLIVADGKVVLRGKLPRYYLKQVAHATVRALPGVIDVHDEVEVVSL
jgi:osmotically-inducible protein OsmY